MLKLLLTRFWPALIPVFLYLAWLAYARHRARRRGHAVPGLLEGPWVLTASISLVLVMAGFLWLGFSHEATDGTYIPPHLESGQVVPAQVVP